MIRSVLAAGCAAVGPGAMVIRAVSRGRWSAPPSTVGKMMLGGYVVAVALIEEALYRAPISRFAQHERRAAALATAAGSTAGFVLAHVRRDGPRALVPQLINAGCWSVSAFVGRTVRWSIAAHSAYNYAAMSVRARR